ncbi:MAG: Nramp family divalent metal transporter [Firmicutes bacterium]|nr:Nramp family divalent metal transporter [Bacillota bacterium]
MKNFLSHKKQKLFFILSIIGPGLVTVNAGNDAGGIATYASVGASYGYRMLWGLLLITFSLAVIQEMNARMAVVTGKGLADLIREKFGVKLTFFAMLVLLTANFGVILGDFAGIAASMELFGISKYLTVPVVAILIWLLATNGSYRKVEIVFLLFTFTFFGYIISAFLAKPDWKQVFTSIATPTLPLKPDFLLAFIGMIGTTITPYMQFYLQASIVDKNLSIQDYAYEKFDVYLGAFWGNAVSFFIIVCTAATLYKAGISITSAQEAAASLKPLAGEYAFLLFGLGLFGASILAAAVIPLSTSYAICEAFGWERGMDNKFKDAPVFFGIYTSLIVLGGGLILIPGLPLIRVMLVAQQLAGVLCPVILTFMIVLVNDKDIMGAHVNTVTQNIISWGTAVFIIILSLALAISPFFFR